MRPVTENRVKQEILRHLNIHPYNRADSWEYIAGRYEEMFPKQYREVVEEHFSGAAII